MKQSIVITELNKAIVFNGKYMEKSMFDYITSNIPKENNKLQWLKNLLIENGYEIVDICHNANLFPTDAMII